jgi:Kef-type K+ transport system membrane component KefB
MSQIILSIFSKNASALTLLRSRLHVYSLKKVEKILDLAIIIPMFDDVILLIILSLIVIFSPFIAKTIKMPTTPIEIVLGAIFAYAGYLQHNYLFELVAEVGFLYLMVIAGTEVDLKKVLRTNSALIKRILTYLLLLYLFSVSFTLF